MKSTILALSTLLTLSTAHFELIAPESRGFDENNLPQFPCGGQNSVSSTRTPFPLTDGTVAINLGHLTTNIEVLVAFGNNPGSAFNTILRAPFYATGLGSLCIGGISIPEGLNVTAGSNATLQVQSNGDPDGGLYNCADITFVETLSTPQSCTNGSVDISAATVSGHANGTAFGDDGSEPEEPTPSATPSESASGASASATPSATPSESGSGAGASATPSQTAAPGAGSVVSASLGGLVLAGVAALAIVM